MDFRSRDLAVQVDRNDGVNCNEKSCHGPTEPTTCIDNSKVTCGKCNQPQAGPEELALLRRQLQQALLGTA